MLKVDVNANDDDNLNEERNVDVVLKSVASMMMLVMMLIVGVFCL